MVKGVRINCAGDRKIFNRPHFEEVEVSLTDPIFSDHDTSDIAGRIGLPIFTRRCPPNPKWANDEDNQIFKPGSPFNNENATYLHLCCDPNANDDLDPCKGWGYAPMKWQNGVGSAIVVRQDKKPLSAFDVEALSRYCRYEISPLFAHSHGEYDADEPMSEADVLAMIRRSTFDIHWYKLLDEKIEKGESTIPDFPYDV